VTRLAKYGFTAHVLRGLSIYVFELLGIGIAYFVLAKIGLTLASINPSASAVWPATGFALASVLAWGYRVGPAVFVAAFAANVTNGASIYAATAIAVGNMLEALVAAWLVNLWSDGRETFTTPMGVAKFALICVPSTIISATVGIAGLILFGHADPIAFPMTWITWWLGDLAGALVVAPFVVLWAASELHSLERIRSWEAGAVVAATIAVGIIAFSPLIEQTDYRDPLAFIALVPLLWAALRRDQRETATVAVILACFAVWGTLAGGGPFARSGLNDSFLLLVMFFISISVPSLALSADVLMRRRSEENLRRTQEELETRARQLKVMAERLQESNTQLEERVEQRTRELDEASRAKTRFIAAASHDLRQPLHALGLFVARLHGRVKAAERNRIVEQIDASVADMNELFNDLLDISKFDAGVLVPNISEFPIAQLLKRTESTFSATARERGLSLRIVRNSAWVRSDSILLERILLNLVSNAVNYTTRGGVVVGCRRRGGQLRIEVYDSGPGIPEDQRLNIFREFYQLGGPQRERRGGLGLGLAIVDRLCRLLKHQIDFASALGKGSRFSVLVPIVPARALTVEPKASVHATLDSIGGKLVVVIDDDPLVLESTGGLLRSWGCHVVTAGSARVALTGLAECNQSPDLIISDYRLSDGQTGIEAIEELRKSLNLPIPAFLISGDTAPERMREVHASGYHLLHKPVHPRALRAMLRQFLKKHDLADVSV
jgi:signal transduction histidine kinase